MLDIDLLLATMELHLSKEKMINLFYFPYVYEILNSLNHEYTTNKNRYSTSINLENASIDKLYKIVEKYFPNIEKSIEDKLKRYKEHLEEEREDINSRPNLSDIEKYISYKS